jgi:DNA-binding PadR family transcriptional regulator
MMNELFVLGELMEEPQNGYQLRGMMQVSLGRHRKISFGVIYPLFERLANAGLITLENESTGRNQTIATITDKGKERFFEMMEQPIPEGAHNADIYLIKLDVMQHLPIDKQLHLLDEFIHEQDIIIAEAQQDIEKLLKEPCVDHWYAQKKFELRLEQAMLSMKWAKTFRQDLENKAFKGDGNG